PRPRLERGRPPDPRGVPGAAGMSGRVLMFVGAHPDDETFGPGGTLARYAAEGVRVVYACATRGEAGSAEPDELGGQRWAELMSAAKAARLAGEPPPARADAGGPRGRDPRSGGGDPQRAASGRDHVRPDRRLPPSR